MLRKLFTLMVMFSFPVLANAFPTDTGKPVKVITDADISALNYWSADTIWNIQGFCYVENGEVLIIEPGTIIKGNEGVAASATALIVARGGKIYAEGTPCNPIIFTSLVDLVDDAGDIDLDDRTDATSRWGGLILLGAAKVNTSTPTTNSIEGIPDTELRAHYGGSNDNDNSGVLRYISIRHAGSEIGASNEINGLTCGGVGRGTEISHVEVFYNFDDGFEFFGGTVNSDHLVSAFCGDDNFDTDQGFRGNIQFAFIIQEDSVGDRFGEHDGGTVPEDGSPFATPFYSNITAIGRGATAPGSQIAMIFRDNGAGAYFNSIFSDFKNFGITVETEVAQPTDSRARLLQGQIKHKNNIWFGFGNGNGINNITNNDSLVANRVFNNGNDYIGNPTFVGVSRIPNNGLDPRPTTLGATGWTGWTNPLSAANGYNPPPPATGYPSAIDVSWGDSLGFCPTTYPGAFDPSDPNLWVYGWTALDQYDFLRGTGTQITGCECTVDTTCSGDFKPINVVAAGNLAMDTTYWGPDSVWLLAGRTFVDNGQVLIIGPGTIIKGQEGNPPTDASVLIVARGGKIYANGSECCPIIMTAENDLVVDPDDLDYGNPTDVRGRWGALILLGAAKTNTALGANNHIEGIPDTELRGLYGGSNDNDNSGVIKYVSIRHGGQEIGASNEINGVSFGAVGRGTVVSHIEVYYNFDDGFEFFGGTVNCDHLISAFCADDNLDTDEGYRGRIQFAISIQDSTIGDRGGEHDGGTIPEDGSPFSTPVYCNVTHIGRGTNGTGGGQSIIFRDNGAGAYFNSIFYDYKTFGITVEKEAAQATDAEDRLTQGQLHLVNNLFYKFGNGNTAAKISGDSVYVQNAVFTSGLNYAQDPGLVINSRHRQLFDIDPRPRNLGATSWTGWKNPLNPANGFNPIPSATGYPSAIDVAYSPFDSVPYPGAFDPSLTIAQSWVYGWSMLWCDGYLSELNPQCCVGNRGDVNGDGTDANILDLTFIVDRIFRGGQVASCPAEGDLNGDGNTTNILDLTFCVDRIFRGGPVAGPCNARIADSEAEPRALGTITANVNDGRTVLSLDMPENLNGIQIELVGIGTEWGVVSKISPEVEMLTMSNGRELRVGLVDLQGLEVIKKGSQSLVELDGEYQIQSVLASDMNNRGIAPVVNQSALITSLPVAYELEQNYPNPFNPATEISFSLPEQTHVNLEIYNVLGQRVITLVNEQMEAGAHEVTWDSKDNDGSSVASGIYLYRLNTDKFSQSRKMMLLK